MPWNTRLASALNQLQKPFRRQSPVSMPVPPPEALSTHITHLSNLTLLSILSKPGRNRPALPLELILEILSYPTCWILADHLKLEKPVVVSSRKGTQVLLRTQPFSQKQLTSLRKIIFSFSSRDQGWSSYYSDHGTYENSWTWFTMAIVKPSDPPSSPSISESDSDINSQPLDPHHHHYPPSPTEPQNAIPSDHTTATHLLQRNRHASRSEEDYRIDLTAGDKDGPLKGLQVGDVVELWACAQFAGWENHIKDAAVEIWTVDDGVF